MKTDPDDLYLWPNGDYCTRDEYSNESNKSDDFEVIPYGTNRWNELSYPE